MIIRPFFIPGIAHSSYLVAGDQSCAVIDPSRDIGHYLRAAREMGVAITHILETHLHADFISGHLDLARATGAMVFAPRQAACTCPTRPCPREMKSGWRRSGSLSLKRPGIPRNISVT